MNEPDILKTNDEIARKFGKIEADLAGCTDMGTLFERLILGSEAAFGVPFVWLSLLRIPATEALRNRLGESDLLRERINVIEPAPFLEVLQNAAQPLLAGGDLRRFFRLMPPNVKYFLRSLAVAPLTCNGLLIGSLNHGDPSHDRYRPGMETDLLGHLAGTVSERLSPLLTSAEPDAAGNGRGG